MPTWFFVCQGHTEKQTQKKASKTESTGGKQDSDTDRKKV